MRTLSPSSVVAALLLATACDRPIDRVVAPGDAVFSPVHRNSTLGVGDVRTIFGPQFVARTTGEPTTATFELLGYAPDATLRITNGDANGRSRVTSGTVAVDGLEVVHPSDFGQKVASIVIPITLRNASIISVRVAGSPGDQLTLSVDGSLATTASVSQAGGTIHLLGSQVTLTAPAGAVGGTVQLTAAPVTAPRPEAVPGTSIDLGPTGTVFSSPVTLSIAFDPAALPVGVRPTSLRMKWWNVDHWEALPGNSVDVQRGVVSATITHFSEFALSWNEVLFCPGDASAESDLRTAITHVPANGTVYVCDGQHSVGTVLVDRPLTLRSLNPGGATLADVEPNQVGTAILYINGVSSGLVRITDLGIAVTDQGIRSAGVYDKVEIDNVRFTGTTGSFRIAVAVDSSTVPNARVDVTNSAFTQLQLGVWSVRAVETNVRHSRFDRFTGGGVVYSHGNTATTQSFGRTEDNEFTNCGFNGCVRVLTAGAVTIARNRFEALDQPVTTGAITVSPSVAFPSSSPTVIEDNVIISRRTGSPEMTPSGWMFQSGISLTDPNARTAVIRRNRVTDVYSGVTSTASVSVTDNWFTGGVYAIRQTAARAVTFQRNDAVGLLGSFTVPLAGANYQCNWWGSTAGPTAPPAGSIWIYKPWASEPIAGTSVGCQPVVAGDLQEVRVCDLPGNGVTVSTVEEAYFRIAEGGTVLFCDGTFTVNNWLIGKPLTVTAEGPGMPTLEAGGGPRVLSVSGMPSGAVEISKLRFTGGSTEQVLLGARGSASIIIAGNDFSPPAGSFAVQIGGRGAGGVSVDHNSFNGGLMGVFASALYSAELHVTRNNFRGTTHSAVNLAHSLDTDDAHPSAISVEENTFEDCGTVCVMAFLPVRIADNAFTANIGLPMARGPIQIGTPFVIQSTYVVTNNTIIGQGNNATSRSEAGTYPIRGAAISILATRADVSGNRITNAFFGIQANAYVNPGGQTSGPFVTAVDNTIGTTYAPISLILVSSNTAGSMTVNWNDFSDYVYFASNQGSTATLSYRCNWWGQTTGPTATLYPVLPEVYTPYATSPVAGQARTGCTP